MPVLEYLLQDLVLTEPECNTINSKIMQTFKHKIHLPTTAVNSGIYMHTEYKIFNIYDCQLELHSKNLLNRLKVTTSVDGYPTLDSNTSKISFGSHKTLPQHRNNSKPKDI